MKVSLVTATSVTALLALDPGSALAASFSLSPTPLNFGDTLVNCGAISGCVVNTLNETATRSGSSGTASITFNAPTASTVYTGGGSGIFPGGNNTTVSQSYTFAPAITGTAGANASQTIAVTSGTTSHNFTIKGTGVAPTESTKITNVAGKGGGVANSGNLGNILVGQTADATVTIKNTGNGNKDTRQATSVSNLNGKQSFSGAADFVGPAPSGFSLNDSGSTTFTYTYQPTARSNGAPESITATSAFSDGSKDGKNTAATETFAISGTAVAPVNSWTQTSTPTARVGTSTSAKNALTVTNIGDGNTAGADNGTTLLSNLRGTVTPTTGAFAGTGGPVNLKDGKSATFDYTFAPTTRGTNSAAVVILYSNGSSNGTNSAQMVDAALNGQGVGPVYQSRLGTTAANAPFGPVNTPPLAGKSVVDFGAVSTFSHNTLYLDLANISTDPGAAALTDLTLISDSLSGASAFGLTGFKAGTLLHEGRDVVLPITFTPGSAGSFIANLTFLTDENAPLGAAGDTFSYTLEGSAGVPEPGSLLLLGAGLGGFFAVRHRRRKR
jgi:hypothetical protein